MVETKTTINKKEEKCLHLWSVDRLAEYLAVLVATVRDWCYKRTLPFIKVGRLVRFKPEDIETWLEASRIPERRW